MISRSKLLVFGIVSVFALGFAVDNVYSDPPPGKGQKVKAAPLARTGQITSYATGDDGDRQAGVPSPTPRFADNGDNTVTDRLTGLTWTKDASGFQIQWTDALNVCNSYAVGKLDDWRLPNIRELLSLLDFEQSNPMLPIGHPFTNVATSAPRYWSSTTNSVFDTHHDVYAVGIDNGEIRIWNKSSGGYILCVQGGVLE